MQGIIIGGGIGGLTTAIALRRLGIRADVYEQAPKFRDVGAGLILASNAMQVFDWLGLAECVWQDGWPLQSVNLTDAAYQPIQTVDAGRLTKRYGQGYLAIHRARLQNQLLTALPTDQIHNGKQLTEVTDDGRLVRVCFADGTGAEADFVIGADGIRSRVRSQLAGNRSLRYSGQTCWRAIVDYALPESLSHDALEIWGPGRGQRVGIVPMSRHQVYVYITTGAPAGQSDQPGEARANILRVGAGFGGLVNEVLHATDESRLFRADLYDLPTLPNWWRGRVALLGDAAHATTPNLGQGACQAIEDAWAVAGCLAGSTLPDMAFGQFQRVRKPKADRVVSISRLIGRLANRTGLVRQLIYALMRHTPTTISQRQFDTILSTKPLEQFHSV